MLQEKLITTLSKSYRNGKRIRRNLPEHSKLVIEQKLPYLCVYRFRKKPSAYLSSLLKTQGAYLLANTSVNFSGLLQALISVGVQDFKTFMLIEIWPDENKENRDEIIIKHPAGKVEDVMSILKKGFTSFKVKLPGLHVTMQDTDMRYPSSMKPLIPIAEIKEKGILLLGICLPALLAKRGSQTTLPYYFRFIRQQFSKTIKQAAYQFVRLQSDNVFAHYLSLGKTQVDNLVRSADKQLAKICEDMDFLLKVTPINNAAAWDAFEKSNYSKAPQFTYRLITVDPENEKRKLFNIPLENIEHPTLAFLLREKRQELEKQLIMLEERGSKKFMYTSVSLFGTISDEVLTIAKNILLRDHNQERREITHLGSTDFARAARLQMNAYKKKFPQLDLTVRVRKDISGLLVSGSCLYVGKDLHISRRRLEPLIQHEVGTHILTYCNGHLQPLDLMYRGLAGYEQLQEGLAVFSEYLVGGLTHNRMKTLAGRVVAVHSLTHGASFVETFRSLQNDYGFTDKSAFNIAARVYRGGGYTKDSIYLKGLVQVLRFLRDGGDIAKLYGGKFALEHMPLIEELLHLDILKQPLLPAFLQNKPVIKKLKKAEKGLSMQDLLPK